MTKHGKDFSTPLYSGPGDGDGTTGEDGTETPPVGGDTSV